MNLELLEHELAQLDGRNVVVVSPSFGNVSFAYAGQLSKIVYPDATVRFHLITTMHEVAIMFNATDVTALENPSDGIKADKVIRLKGPHDYQESFVH